MKGNDNYSKLRSSDSADADSANLGLSSPLAAFRMRAFFNLIAHLIFAGLYAFEHNNQVILRQSDEISANNTVMGNARLEEEAKVEEVFTPVSNVIIMVMNLILATLILLIAIQIDS